VTRVLALMERLPKTWSRREDFVAAIEADGQTPELAQWLAMNVTARDGGFALRLDLVALREMLRDYYARDLWDVAFDVELPGTLEVVVAERARTVSAADRARLEAAPSHVHTHRVDTGHWLHVEAPATVVDLLASQLPTSLH
jgi:hypothetical protein